MRSFVCAALLAGVACAAAGASPPPRLAGRIAFSAGPLEPGRSNIFVYDLRTSKTVQLTHGDGIEFDPALSPDGTRVAWRSVRDGNEEIRVADVDGTNVRNVTHHPAADYAPAWSPDGRRIAFASTRGAGVPHIWLMNADGTNVHVLSRTAEGEYPAWSGDGRIAFATNQPVRQDGFDLVVADVDGGSVHRLTRNDIYEMGPAWAPNGRWLAFYAGNGGRHAVYVMRPNGRHRRRLTRGGGELPSWSPDGSAIAYAAGHPDGTTDVTVVPSGGGVGVVLARSPSSEFPESWK
jgi:TolB protein